MARYQFTAALLLFGILVATIGGSSAADERRAAFMRTKLTNSQQILEGLTLEDYDRIVKAAEQMRLLSLDESWQVIQSPEYVERSRDFRRAAEMLKENAVAQNVDGSTLAFFQMTQNCVSCHKYVRKVGE